MVEITQPKQVSIDDYIKGYTPNPIPKGDGLPLGYCPLEKRKENAERLRNVIADGMSDGRDLYKLSISIAERVLWDYDKAEEVVCQLISNMMDGKAKTYQYFVNDKISALKDNRLMHWWFANIFHLCVDYQRAEYRNRKINFTEFDSSNDEYGRNIIEKIHAQKLFELPEEQVIKKGYIERIRTAITKLNYEHSILISMRYFSELKYREMAEILGIPIGTVKSRLHDAIEKLKGLPEIVKLGRSLFKED